MKSMRANHCRFIVFWLIAVFPAVASYYPQADPVNPPYLHIGGIVTGQPSQQVINSACDKIFVGDFESVQRILSGAAASDSQDLMRLRKIVNEYTVIDGRRKALQREAYQMQIDELRRKGLSDDVNDIREAFEVVLNVLEYADKEQKQALLKDPFLIQTIQKAKAKAAEFEANGRWLDAYTICYSKLRQIYEENKIYSDYAEQLLKKANIETSLKDSPCE